MLLARAVRLPSLLLVFCQVKQERRYAYSTIIVPCTEHCTRMVIKRQKWNGMYRELFSLHISCNGYEHSFFVQLASNFPPQPVKTT